VRTSHHFLTTQTEPCGFTKLSAQTYIVHMKLSLHLSFPDQTQLQRLHDGHPHEISSLDHGRLSHIVTPWNPTVAPTTSYEYLLCLPSSDRLRPPAQWKARGLLSGSCTPGYRRTLVMAQKSRYGWFPPVANSRGTKHPVLCMAPQLLTKEDGSPT
jgi:hypothetical protein